jgi:hypothetical protein
MGSSDKQSNGLLFSRPFIHDGLHHMVVAKPHANGFCIFAVDMAHDGAVTVAGLLPNEGPCSIGKAMARLEAFDEINGRLAAPRSEQLTPERAAAAVLQLT